MIDFKLSFVNKQLDLIILKSFNLEQLVKHVSAQAKTQAKYYVDIFQQVHKITSVASE